VRAHFARFAARLPKRLGEQLEATERRLAAASQQR